MISEDRSPSMDSGSTPVAPDSPAAPVTDFLHNEKKKCAFLVAVLLVMAGLIFAQLDHYAMWDDETMISLVAKGIMRTGDTSVLMDHGNIVAYRGGLLVRDFCDRSIPPFAAYLTAASFSLFGIDTYAARLPFALLGVATVLLMLLWARRENGIALLLLAAALVGNVQMVLFFRQCRYYSPTIFFAVAITYLYWRWKPTPRTLLLMALLSVLLFVSNYMNYVAFYAALAIDYVIWRRKEWRLGWLQWLCLLGPQVVLNGALAQIWNPLKTHMGDAEVADTLWDRATLFYWYWRDMNQSEFFALPVVILALAVGFTHRRMWLVRGVLAMIVFVAAVSLVTPQIVRQSLQGEVRYLTPLLPLAIALEAGTLYTLLSHRKIVLGLAATAIFGTNLLNGGPFLPQGFRSTFLSYLGELSFPQTEPYTPTAEWINDNLPENASVWVQPYYMAYPLMFHAPGVLYAWQLDWPPRSDFANLPRIQFIGQEPPDYLIGFGASMMVDAQGETESVPVIAQMLHELHYRFPNVGYQQVATINVFGHDNYRPEIYWRKFESVTTYDPATEAVYIFQRTTSPISAK